MRTRGGGRGPFRRLDACGGRRAPDAARRAWRTSGFHAASASASRGRRRGGRLLHPPSTWMPVIGRRSALGGATPREVPAHGSHPLRQIPSEDRAIRRYRADDAERRDEDAARRRNRFRRRGSTDAPATHPTNPKQSGRGQDQAEDEKARLVEGGDGLDREEAPKQASDDAELGVVVAWRGSAVPGS